MLQNCEILPTGNPGMLPLNAPVTGGGYCLPMPSLRPWLQTRLRLLRVGSHLLWGAALTLLLFPVASESGRMRLRSIWSRQLLEILEVRIEASVDIESGLEAGLLVANHISFLDIFVINAVSPAAFVAKSDVAGWPLIGWLAGRNGTVFIERGSRQAAHGARQAMLAALGRGERLAIFPEGTTTAGDRVLPFHGALFQGAIDARASVHALALSYHHADGSRSAAPAYTDDLSVMDCLQRILQARGLVARLSLAARFRHPLPDRRQLAHRAHQAVVTALANAR